MDTFRPKLVDVYRTEATMFAESAVLKINSSGLSPVEKGNLKALIGTNNEIMNQIAEDDQIRDELLREYLTGSSGTID